MLFSLFRGKVCLQHYSAQTHLDHLGDYSEYVVVVVIISSCIKSGNYFWLS